MNACGYVFVIDGETDVSDTEPKIVQPRHRGIVWYGQILFYFLSRHCVPELTQMFIGCYSNVEAIKTVGDLLLLCTVQDVVGLHSVYLNTTTNENSNYWTQKRYWKRIRETTSNVRTRHSGNIPQ